MKIQAVLVFGLGLWFGVASADDDCGLLDPGPGSEAAAESLMAFTGCLFRNHSYPAVIRVLEENRASISESPQALMLLGLAYMELGRSGNSHEALAQAYRLDPDNRDIASHLSQVLFQRAVEVSPIQAERRASVLGEACRNDSGLPRKEAQHLTRELIDEARNLTRELINLAENPNLRIQYQFQMLDLNELAGQFVPPERRLGLLRMQRNIVDRTDDPIAREMYVYRLINTANSAEVVDDDPALAASLTDLARAYADTPELQRIVNQMTSDQGSLDRPDRLHPSLAGLVSQPCVLGMPME